MTALPQKVIRSIETKPEVLSAFLMRNPEMLEAVGNAYLDPTAFSSGNLQAAPQALPTAQDQVAPLIAAIKREPAPLEKLLETNLGILRALASIYSVLPDYPHENLTAALQTLPEASREPSEALKTGLERYVRSGTNTGLDGCGFMMGNIPPDLLSSNGVQLLTHYVTTDPVKGLLWVDVTSSQARFPDVVVADFERGPGKFSEWLKEGGPNRQGKRFNFVTVYSSTLSDQGTLEVHTVRCVVGPGLVITIHDGSDAEIESARPHFVDRFGYYSKNGAGALTAAIVETMLFDDLRQVETLQDNVGKLSAKAMKSALASNDYHELNVYEERLQHLELVFARNQRISAALGGHSALFPEGNERLLTQLSEQLQHAMRDVSHLTGNIDRVERRFEKQQASQQNRLLNNIAKVQLCATPAVVIGGFWGMNFPQTSAASNIFFWGTLSTMAAATAAIFWWSKKTHPPH